MKVKSPDTTLVCLLPHKTISLSATWVLERVGTAVYVWSTSEAYQKGLQHAVHTQHFDCEIDASGAQHLFTEAAKESITQSTRTVDLRTLCFWEETSGVEPATSKRPNGISLASLFHKGAP
jgi:hypothetical protein